MLEGATFRRCGDEQPSAVDMVVERKVARFTSHCFCLYLIKPAISDYTWHGMRVQPHACGCGTWCEVGKTMPDLDSTFLLALWRSGENAVENNGMNRVWQGFEPALGQKNSPRCQPLFFPSQMFPPREAAKLLPVRDVPAHVRLENSRRGRTEFRQMARIKRTMIAGFESTSLINPVPDRESQPLSMEAVHEDTRPRHIARVV